MPLFVKASLSLYRIPHEPEYRGHTTFLGGGKNGNAILESKNMFFDSAVT